MANLLERHVVAGAPAKSSEPKSTHRNLAWMAPSGDFLQSEHNAPHSGSRPSIAARQQRAGAKQQAALKARLDGVPARMVSSTLPGILK